MSRGTSTSKAFEPFPIVWIFLYNCVNIRSVWLKDSNISSVCSISSSLVTSISSIYWISPTRLRLCSRSIIKVVSTRILYCKKFVLSPKFFLEFIALYIKYFFNFITSSVSGSNFFVKFLDLFVFNSLRARLPIKRPQFGSIILRKSFNSSNIFLELSKAALLIMLSFLHIRYMVISIKSLSVFPWCKAYDADPYDLPLSE